MRNEEIAPPVKLYVIHANNLEVAIQEKEKLQKQYPHADIEIGHFGPVIGSHLGEKSNRACHLCAIILIIQFNASIVSHSLGYDAFFAFFLYKAYNP